MQGYAFGAESAGELFVASRDLRAAIWTGTLLAQIVVANVVPVTNHTRVLAVRTKRCAACGVMHVTGVNVMQPCMLPMLLEPRLSVLVAAPVMAGHDGKIRKIMGMSRPQGLC